MIWSLAFGLNILQATDSKQIIMAFSLPALPYEYTALAPHIDAETMTIHHTKHHQASQCDLRFDFIIALNCREESNVAWAIEWRDSFS
jgi:hypothetical protein